MAMDVDCGVLYFDHVAFHHGQLFAQLGILFVVDFTLLLIHIGSSSDFTDFIE